MKKKYLLIILIFLLGLSVYFNMYFFDNDNALKVNDFYAFEENLLSITKEDDLQGIEIKNNQDISKLTSNSNINLVANQDASDDTINYLSLKQYCDTHDYYINKTENGYAIYKTFGLKRLIVTGEYTNNYSAITVVSYNDLHIFAYSTEEDTRWAYNRLLKDKVNVTIDTVVTTASYSMTDYDYSSYKNWGAEALDIGGYREYLQDNNVNKQIAVVVLDTGINTAHEVFSNRFIKENGQIVGYSYYNTKYTYSGYSFEDDRGHGTHVSGIICDLTPSNVKIIPIRVLGSGGSGSTTNILAGLQRVIDVYSASYDIACVNMSLGGGYIQSEYNNYKGVFDKLLSKNILSVVAAGNDNDDASNYIPAACENAIVVSALKSSSNGYVFDNTYSNYGSHVDISAPGTQITAAYIANVNLDVPNLYQTLNGTSMATPQVAGAVALLCLDPKYIEGGNFNYTASEIESRLKINAIDMGAIGKDKYYGYGMVNLRYFAVNESSATISFVKDDNVIASDGDFIEFIEFFDLKITCSDNSYKIYYTIDNFIPSVSNESLYLEPFKINKTITIYAIAYKVSNGAIVERTAVSCISLFYNSGNLDDYFDVNYFGELINYTGHFKTLTIPDRIDGELVEGIGNSLFLNTEIESVTLTSNVKVISGYAFQRCENLHYLYAPSVELVYLGAFDNCHSITIITSDDIKDETTGVYLPKLSKTKSFAFSNCINLQSIQLNSLTFQDVNVETETFANCINLVSCELPNIVSIPNNTFYNCNKLKTFNINKNVNELGQNPFYNCISLEKITVDEENKYLYSDKDVAVYTNEALVAFATKANISNYSILGAVAINGQTHIITTIYDLVLKEVVLEELVIPSSIIVMGNACVQDAVIETVYLNATNLTCDGYVTYDDKGEEFSGPPFRYGHISNFIVSSNVKVLPRRLCQYAGIQNIYINSLNTTYEVSVFNTMSTDPNLYLEFTGITSAWVENFKNAYLFPNAIFSKSSIPNYSSLRVYCDWGLILGYYTYSVVGGKITATASTGGNINPKGEIVVLGGDCTFTITPNNGYIIKAVYVDNNNIGSVDSYTFESVNRNHTIRAEFVAVTYNTYTITVTSGVGGMISPSNNIVLNEGASQTFTITPNNGYRIKDVIVNGVSKGAVSTYTFSNIKANQTILAVFEKIQYSVNIVCDTNGQVSPNITSVEYGASLTFTISPNVGYKIKEVRINNVIQAINTTYTISNIQADITLKVTFEKISYRINVTSGEGGVVVPETSSVFYGESLEFVFTPNVGYKVKQVIIDGVSKGEISSYTFSNVQSNHNLQVVFEKIKFLISISYGENGIISPNITSVEYGDSVTYTISPNNGYKIKDVLVDGVSVGAKNKYTFSNITSNHTISAEFSDARIYEINVTCDNATYQLDTLAEIIYGESRTILFTANEGYKITSIFVNGESIGAVESYTIENIKENYNIVVNSEKIKFIINIACGENGELSHTGEISVDYNESLEVFIYPNSGYSIDTIYVDDVQIDNIDSYAFENIKANHSISVTFKLTGFLMNVQVVGNGVVECSDGNGVNVGGNKIYRVTPEIGWEVYSIIVNGKEMFLTDGKLVLTEILDPCDIKVEFRKIEESSTQESTLLGLILFIGLFIVMPLTLIVIYFITSRKVKDRI